MNKHIREEVQRIVNDCIKNATKDWDQNRPNYSEDGRERDESWWQDSYGFQRNVEHGEAIQLNAYSHTRAYKNNVTIFVQRNRYKTFRPRIDYFEDYGDWSIPIPFVNTYWGSIQIGVVTTDPKGLQNEKERLYLTFNKYEAKWVFYQFHKAELDVPMARLLALYIDADMHK